MCCNSAHPIADIFVLAGDIVIRGWGKGRAGWGERLQETEGRRGWGHQIRREEQGRIKGNKRRDRGGKENDGGDNDDGGKGKWATERKVTLEGKQLRSRGVYREEGTCREESSDKRSKWSGLDSKGLAMEEEAETAGGEWGEINADGEGMGHTRDRSGRATRGPDGRRQQNREGHLRGRQQGGSGRPP